MSVDDVIAEIKKEIVESHNLIIKTDNLVKNLSAEIRQVQKKQEKYERKYIFNSVVAYVIFVVVIFGGLYVAFDAKVGVVRKEKESLEESLKKAESEIRSLQGKLSVRAQQEKVTERFLYLRKQKRPFDALKVAEDLDPNLLSPVLARLVEKESAELRQELGKDAFEAGKTLFQKAHLSKALREFNRALEVKPPDKLFARIHHQRAMVLLKLNRNAQAAESFLAAADADPESSSADKVLFMAANTLEASGDVPRALEVYQRLLKEHSSSPYASQARRRIARLNRGKIDLDKPLKKENKEQPATQRPVRKEKPAPAAKPGHEPEKEHEKPAGTSRVKKNP